MKAPSACAADVPCGPNLKLPTPLFFVRDGTFLQGEGNIMDGGDRCNRFEKHMIPDTWPATQSLLLAFCLEVVPIEWWLMECFESLLPYGAIATKVTCLALICLPLLIFCARNGLNALNYVLGRVAIVAAIIAINLFVFYLFVIRNDVSI